MIPYRLLWPLVRRLPPEFAHAAGLRFLRLPIRFGPTVDDAFDFRGLQFRNRVGIAAGFDKNAACLPGIERLGAGFVEVGTILIAPWGGNAVAPRMARLAPQRAIWNRLGFTSDGVRAVQQRLQRFPPERRRGLVIAANIGPHPGNLKAAADPLTTARTEFLQLVEELHDSCAMFVINLSSPNTPRLRSLLQSPDLAEHVVGPIRDRLRELDHRVRRAWQTPLLVKLPPEDQEREPWSEIALRMVLDPLRDRCDGFVAVNTSTRLAAALVHYPPAELPGGVSGAPLRAEAVRVIRLLRGLLQPDQLLIGCGGVMEPADALELRAAGADLVEIYSGMIFAGPGLASQCARALRLNRPSAAPPD